MTERLPSDHEAVDSHRVHLGQVGRTSRPSLPLPDTLDVSPDDTCRLSLEGETYHAQVSQSLDGDAVIEGAYANARIARTGDGENHFQAWTDSVDLTPGDPVLVDVVTPGFKYGVRRPGERVVYDATAAPSGSLSDIARNLDG